VSRGTTLTADNHPQPFTVKIICTDKGQHKRYALARAVWDPSHGDDGHVRLTHGLVGPWLPPAGWTPKGEGLFAWGEWEATAESHVPREAYVFWCPGCNRTPQIKHEKFWQMIDDFVRVGFPLLDISRLPF
jgi:hypothetical protein